MQIPAKQYWILLRKYLRPQWVPVLFLAGTLFSNIALLLINPQIIRKFIDTAQEGTTGIALYHIALLFLVLALFQQIMTVAASYLSEIVAWTATNALRVELASHCLGLDLSFHNSHTPGEMIERLDGDINNLANFFSRFVIELSGNAILMVGVLALMWLENWLIGLGLTFFIASSMFILLRYRNVAVPYWAAERQASADFYGFLEERLSGTEDIRANGAVAYVMRNFHSLIRQMLQKSLKSAMVINILININQFLFAAGIAAAFAISTYLFQDGTITIGAVYLIYHYTSMLNRPMENIAHQVDQLQRAGAGIIRIHELFKIESKISNTFLADPSTPTMQSNATGCNDILQQSNIFAQRKPAFERNGTPITLRFENVTFGYDDSMPQVSTSNKNKGVTNDQCTKDIVLQNVTFTLEAGKVLGLLGRTGSGKTTLTRLIFRFYDPDKGSISIASEGKPGMVDIRSLPLETLRQQVGIVTQNIQLFNASVRDNLTFFDPTIPDVFIEEILNQLGLTDWLSSFSEGLDTVLESGGGGLSAGEAQLLAFARIFLFDPGLVVLDEASSRLDPATEVLIERGITRLVKNRTSIVIAHRLKTVQKADQIMILDRGRILEFGERVKLEKNPDSKFNQLLKTGLEEVLA